MNAWTGKAGEPAPVELWHRSESTSGNPWWEPTHHCGCGHRWRGLEPTDLCPVAVAQRLAELEASVRAAKDRADAAESCCATRGSSTSAP